MVRAFGVGAAVCGLLLVGCGGTELSGQRALDVVNATEQMAVSRQPLTTVLTSNGGYLAASRSDALSAQDVVATLSSAGNVTEIFLTYNAFSVDPTSQVCVPDPVVGTYCTYTRTTFDFATGTLSPGDIAVTNRAGRLTTNLLNNPGMTFDRCIIDSVAGTTDCTTRPASGQISLTWQRTREYARVTKGTNDVRIGTNRIKTSGTQTEYSSLATGVLLGQPFSDFPSARLGTNSSVSIEITRGL
jgi:hypothetical protein